MSEYVYLSEILWIVFFKHVDLFSQVLCNLINFLASWIAEHDLVQAHLRTISWITGRFKISASRSELPDQASTLLSILNINITSTLRQHYINGINGIEVNTFLIL